MEISLKEAEQYVSDLTYTFLEEAPTLLGLPISFLPQDVLVNSEKGFIYLDFTTSKDLDRIIKSILARISMDDIVAIFKAHEGLDINSKIFTKIRQSYHMGFYNNVHLEAKKASSDYMLRVFDKYTHKLSKEHRERLYEQYGVVDSLYPRGLMDYDYSKVGLDVKDKNLIPKMNKSLEKIVSEYIHDNKLIREDSNNFSFTKGENDNVLFIIEKDSQNPVYIRPRIEKIMQKNKDFYTTGIKDYTVAYSFRIPECSLQIPLIKIKSEYSSTINAYITPFSAYIHVIHGGKSKIYTIYHIGRNTNEECLEKMKSAITTFKLPQYCLLFTKNISLR